MTGVSLGVGSLPEIEWIYNPVSLSLLAILLAATYMWRQQHHLCDYPPGPFNFPLIGNIPQVMLAGSMDKFLEVNRKKYGDVFTIQLGGSRRVVISGYDNIYQLLVKNADFTSNRHPGSLPKSFQEVISKRPGLVWASFPHWKTLRSFALNVMRKEGMGKASLEPKIIEEVDMFCNHFIEPRLGHPVDLSNDLAKVTCNIISDLVFGGRSDYEDANFKKLVSVLVKNIQRAYVIGMIQNLPAVNYLLQKAFSDGTNFLRDTIQKSIDEHLKDLKVDDPKDIIDEFLIHKAKLKEGGAEDNCFTDGNLITVVNQLYGAGTETTSTALRWALLFTAYYPDVMSKVQEEIRTEIGLEKSVEFADRGHMPYVDALLHETLRFANIAPLALPHLLEGDYQLAGKSIRAGSDLLMNMASVLHDEEMFDSPERFDPNRYLTGDVALKKKRTIPFSLGRRVCLGESLARMELFLIYVTIMQRYNIKLAEDNSFKIRLSRKPSIINAPQSYRLIFTHI